MVRKVGVIPTSSAIKASAEDTLIHLILKEEEEELNTKDNLIGGIHTMERQDHGASAFLQSVKVEVPAGRYFQAFKGPELEVLTENEDVIQPVDKKWPFLLRFPIACFGMPMGLASQGLLWKTLASSPSVRFLHIPPHVNLAIWSLAVCTLIIVSITYSLKMVFYFEAVRREFCHPVRVNFFFAPWVACMLLTIGVPPIIAESIHPSLWCIFMAPVFILELKVYGQWLSGGEKRLSKVANPSTHLSVVGNFVGSLLAAHVGWKEPAKFFWAVGLAHYLVVFVTLYQRLPSSETLPKELHPVFFLFLAAPSTASVAWKFIYGQYDSVSHTTYFVALFLYASLVVRINLFRGFRFSISWWSYTYPMTAASVATVRYSEEVAHRVTQGLVIALSGIASFTVFTVFVRTLLHLFVWGSLFPNDMAIAIASSKRRKTKSSPKLQNIKGVNHADINGKRRWMIRNSIEILRSAIKNQRARLLQHRELVYPELRLPRDADEEQQQQQMDKTACIDGPRAL